MAMRGQSKPIPFTAERGGSARSSTPVSTVRHQVSFTASSSGRNLSLNSSNSSGMFSPPPVTCNSQDFYHVAERVTDWRALFRHLRQPEDVGNLIEQIESDYHHVKTQEKCIRAMEIWKQKRGRDATLDELILSLIRMGRKDVAEKLCISRGLEISSYPGLDQMHSVISSYSSDVSGFVNLDFGNDIILTEETQVQKHPREIEKLVKALQDPQITVISLAGPENSGKTVTLGLLQKRLEQEESFQRTKIIKIRSTTQVNSLWLSREIALNIQKEPRLEYDQSSYAESSLVGLLGPYDDIILILDLSLNAFSSTGKNVIEYLLKFWKKEPLSKKLRFVISTKTSLWKTSLFLQNRKSYKEIIVEPIKHHEAVQYIKSINETFSKQVARTIVKKIDCYPFYLRQIADADIENIFVCDGKEEIVRAIESRFEELHELLFDPNVEEAVSIVFDCLGEDKQALLTQVLTFANCFGLEQAQRIVHHKIDISDSLFNHLCEQGALFLRRDRTKSKIIVYHIPKIQGDILRKIVDKSEQFSEMYHRALSKHQCLYLELLVQLSNCFMGDAPSKSEELRVLEPFTPSDGVPSHQSLTIEVANERTSRVVAYFRQQHDDIIKSLLYCSHSQENYKAVVTVITQLNVYYFLTYMLCTHESLKIYRKLKREAKGQQDHESLDKLNVYIASLCIDANGQNKYLSEANSLYEASASSLRGNVYAHCIQRMGANKVMECLLLGNGEGKKTAGLEHIKKAKEVFQEKSAGKEASKVYITECTRIEEGISGNYNDENISQMISTCSAVLGSMHPITCSCLMIKGQMHQKRGEYAAAKEIFQKVLDAEEELLGQHWQTARTLLQLALSQMEEIMLDSEESTPDASAKSQLPQKVRFATERNRAEPEVGVEVSEEADNQGPRPGSEKRSPRGGNHQQRQTSMFTVGNGDQAKANRSLDIFDLTIGNGKEYTSPLSAKGGAKSPSGEEAAYLQTGGLLSSSSSSSSRITTRRGKFPSHPEIKGGDNDLLDDIRHMLRKAAGYSLHANGRCEDARICFQALSKISTWYGRVEDARKYAEKAKLCAMTA